MVSLSDILISFEVTTLLFTKIILFVVLGIAAFFAFRILSKYNKTDTSPIQYKLEKQSYLITLIIQVSFMVLIVLLPFFIYSIDKLSNIIPGAMCGAGVFSANSYGVYDILLKILIIMLASLWLSLNEKDQMGENFPYIRIKLWLYIFIFTLFVIELYFELSFFFSLTTQHPVLCCSAIYSDEENPIIFNLTSLNLMLLFYMSSLLLFLTVYLTSRFLLLLITLAYLVVSYYSIVYFFTPYIYELPTHTCPFCMLQSEYNYIGYFIYGFLFMGTFHSLKATIFGFTKKLKKQIIIWYILFLLVSSIHFIIYLLKNSVFL